MCSFNKPFRRRGGSRAGEASLCHLGWLSAFKQSLGAHHAVQAAPAWLEVGGAEQWMSHEGGVKGYLRPWQDSFGKTFALPASRPGFDP